MARPKVRVRAQARTTGFDAGRSFNRFAVVVVTVENREERRTAPIAFEKQMLGWEIVLHRLMKVQMVPREIGEDRGVKAKAIDAPQRQRVRRDLHGGVRCRRPLSTVRRKSAADRAIPAWC